MSLLGDLRTAFTVLARSVRARRSLRDTALFVTMSLIQHRGYGRPGRPVPPSSDDLAGATAPLDSVVAVEVEIPETGLQVRRSGLEVGAEVELGAIPEDIRRPDGPRFTLVVTVVRIGIYGATFRAGLDGDVRRLDCVYDERFDTGLRLPSGNSVAIRATRLS